MNASGSPERLILLPDDAVAAGARSADAEDSVASVNGRPISRGRFDYVVKARRVQSDAGAAEDTNRALDMLISQELLYQEAVRKGYELNPDVATQIEISREEVVIDAYLRDHALSHPISEDMLRAEYEQQKALAGNQEYKLSHIVLDTEEEAALTIAELQKGASFEELAAQNSVDERSKERGGDLGWAPDALQFQDALKPLQKGQITETPVRTDFGWHVFRVDDLRPITSPAFEEVKRSIYASLRRRDVDQIIAGLRAQAAIA